MAVKITATLTLRTTESNAIFKEALYEAMQELFEIEILSTAKELVPVLAEATTERFPGQLRESIDAKVTKLKRGVRGKVFTTSGYGGYVELGTKKMDAEPYIYPAFQEHINKLPGLVKEAIANFVPKSEFSTGQSAAPEGDVG